MEPEQEQGIRRKERHSYLGTYAGFATRLAAFMLDVTIVGVTIVFVTWFLSTSLYMLQLPQIFQELAKRYPVINFLILYIFTPLVGSLVSIIFIIGYHVFFWMMAGQTPGKYIMGVRIVSMDGHKLRLVQALVRYAGYYVSAAALGLGFGWILIDDHRRAWHDRIAQTCVIYAWDARPDENFLAQSTDQMAARIRKIRDQARAARSRLKWVLPPVEHLSRRSEEDHQPDADHLIDSDRHSP